MLICAEMRGTYDAKMVSYIVYKPAKFKKKSIENQGNYYEYSDLCLSTG